MPTVYTPRGTVQPSALLLYAEGEAYADGHAASPEGGLRRGATPRAAVGVEYAEGNALYADGYKPSAYSFIPVVYTSDVNPKARQAGESIHKLNSELHSLHKREENDGAIFLFFYRTSCGYPGNHTHMLLPAMLGGHPR
jgi:hypothetical protein